MRLCYIAPPAIHTNRIVRYFSNNGHEVHLITSAQFHEGNIGNSKLHFLKRVGPRTRVVNYMINSLPLLLQFEKLIEEIKPDIIHAQMITDTALLPAIIGFHPFVVTPWGSDVLTAPRESIIAEKIARYILKKADMITCDAKHIVEPMKQLGADPNKIRFNYFGVDVEEFHPRQRDNKLKEELGVGDSPLIISMRNLLPMYDVESLIKAMPAVLASEPEAKLLVISVGSQYTMLSELTKSLNISDSIKFVGRIKESELPRYIASSDIYVSTSLSDAGLSASTAEAMACELPVIITDFGDNREWVEDGKNGFVIPLKSPEILASRIIYLLQNKEMSKRFGKANRQVIEEENNREKEMESMLHLYEELISNEDNKLCTKTV